MTPELLVIVTAALAIVNGEIAPGIIQWLKARLGITAESPAWQAIALCAVEVSAVTAGYLLIVTKSFTWGTFATAALYAFLRASGLYTENKEAGKTA